MKQQESVVFYCICSAIGNIKKACIRDFAKSFGKVHNYEVSVDTFSSLFS